jgi:hypothetical protein
MEDGKAMTIMNAIPSVNNSGSSENGSGSNSGSPNSTSANHERYTEIELGSGVYHFSSTLTKK